MKALWRVCYFILRVLARLIVLALFEKWVPLDRSLTGRDLTRSPKNAPAKPAAQAPARGRARARGARDEEYDVRFSREGDSIPVALSGEFGQRVVAAKKAGPRRHPLVRDRAALRDAFTLSAALGERPHGRRR